MFSSFFTKINVMRMWEGSAVKLAPRNTDSEICHRFNSSISMEIWFLGLGFPNSLVFFMGVCSFEHTKDCWHDYTLPFGL